MNGSSESQPPRFTPRAGVSPYDPQDFSTGGVLEFALFESSHADINPIIGRPPTVSFV